MLYTIYANKVEEVRRKLEKIASKAEKYGCNFAYTIGEEHPEIVTVRSTDGITAWDIESLTVAAVDVSISCDSLICANGWQVLAHIEHGTQGNIVTAFNCDPLPIWYSLAPHCDHCSTNRNRKETYIVQNENGAQKQVGKSCLKEYTGIIPETAVLFASVRDCLIDDSVTYETASGAERMYSTAQIVALAVDSVAARGYIRSTEPGSTKAAIIDAISKQAEPTTKAMEKAQAILLWLSNLSNDVTGIERDCKPLALSQYCKFSHFGRLAYMPIAYDKEQERKAKEEDRQVAQNAEKCSEYIGTVGEKVSFKAEKAILVTSWATVYGYTYLYKFTCENNVFIWFASRAVSVADGATITGTIKEHSTRDGVKQTILTRCKIK